LLSKILNIFLLNVSAPLFNNYDGSWRGSTTYVTTTSYTDYYYGVYRWRVWAVDSAGRESEKVNGGGLVVIDLLAVN
jgi:hypothetical protein